MGKEIREINRDAIETVQQHLHKGLKIGTILITGREFLHLKLKILKIQKPF